MNSLRRAEFQRVPKAYPVDVFSKILFELAAFYNVTDALNAALKPAGRTRITSE
jgi:hypothetical protein